MKSLLELKGSKDIWDSSSATSNMTLFDTLTEADQHKAVYRMN